MSKTRWKDTLPYVSAPQLDWAAVWLGRALKARREGYCEASRRSAGRAAAHIRGVRKGLGVDSERRELGADLTGAELLWAASGEVAIAAQWLQMGAYRGLPDEPQLAASNCRYAEACIRAYMREMSS